MKARTRGLPLAGTAIIGVRWHLLVCLLLGSIGLLCGCGGGGGDTPDTGLQGAGEVTVAQQARQGPPGPPSLEDWQGRLPAPRARSQTSEDLVAGLEPGQTSGVLELEAGWNMVSFPLSEVTDLALGEGVLGSVFSWDPGTGSYLPADLNLPGDVAAGEGTGRGFWIYSNQASQIQYAGWPNSGVHTETDVTLHAGWNLLGFPFDKAQAYSAVQMWDSEGATWQTLPESVSQALPSPEGQSSMAYACGYLYEGQDYHPVDLSVGTGTFKVGRAMWVYVFRDGEVSMRFATPAPTLLTLAVTPSTPSLIVGAEHQFQAMGTYSDGSTRDLTPEVEWTSSDTTVATIDNSAGANGLVRMVSSGETVITATEPDTSVSGGTKLVVVAPGSLKWSCDLRTSSVYPSPAIGADGTLYVGFGGGSGYGLLRAFSPDGREKWQLVGKGGVTDSSPAVDSDGNVYVGTGIGYLYACQANGAWKWGQWDVNLGGSIDSSPAIGVDGTIYVGANNGYNGDNFSAIRTNGRVKWTFRARGFVETAPAVAADGTIYVSSSDFVVDSSGRLNTSPWHYLYAINPIGTQKWSFYLQGFGGSSPALGTDGTIYLGCDDGYLYAIDPAGAQKWRFHTDDWVRSSPAIAADGTIYFGSCDQYLYAVRPNGTLKWKFYTDHVIGSSPAIGADGAIYVGSNDGYLYAVNADGNLRWKFNAGGAIKCSPVIGADGTIYITSASGKLYAIYGSTPLADGPWPMFHHDPRHSGRQ